MDETEPKAVLYAEDLDVGYSNKAVIKGINVNALRGQTICLIGPNGAGKTTILRTLAGMLAPVDGSVYISQDTINQEDISKVKAADRARYMAVVLTEKPDMNQTTAYEIVSMGRTPFTDFFGRLDEEDHQIIRESMQAVGASDLADRYFNSLSDGEKQKVMIARALAQEPKLIILDEPTSHLDIRHKIEVIRILNQLSQERQLTVILALHDVDIAVKSCQNVLMVKDGEVVAQGKPEDIVQADTIGSLYDILGASYDSVLGSFELCYQNTPEIFVVAGAGTGAPFFRSLSRLGYGIATGILHENDIDFKISSAMHLTVVSEESFSPITDARVQQARSLMSASSCAIDAGFPIGSFNYPNLECLQAYAKDGGTVYSLRSSSEIADLYPGLSVTPIASVSELPAFIPLKRPDTQNGYARLD
ncbi:MAG: ABC transporter ATP-binding protein [Coriobacteriia bacterium]|nr:ABC transporter ATP-binding protein [Coriobacteriia bacterium]